jgi:hypothetical protein
VGGADTLRLYGNMGRYYLALPSRLATGAVLSAALEGSQYFVFTGVDQETGVPTGLTPIPLNPDGAICPGTNLYSSNLECGQAVDPRERVAKDLDATYQDEFILGFDQKLSEHWLWGVKGTYRTLKNAVEDSCPDILGGECYLINAGKANTFYINQGDGTYEEVT